MKQEQLSRFLIDILRRRLSAARLEWLEEAVRNAAASSDDTHLLRCYTTAARKLGRRRLELSPSERDTLRTLDPLPRFDSWRVHDIARAALLLSIGGQTSAGGDSFVQTALSWYQNGDRGEQESWLRALGLLPGCEAFLDTAVDACRTNVVPLFESIACENPYPLRYFPELNFNQMVLKALFNEIAVSRIIGLEDRFGSELSRMANDYVSEREAAGREVPADIWLVVAPRVSADGLARVHQYLHHEDRGHRYWAALGLGYADSTASRRELEKRRSLETDVELIGAIDASLARMAH